MKLTGCVCVSSQTNSPGSYMARDKLFWDSEAKLNKPVAATELRFTGSCSLKKLSLTQTLRGERRLWKRSLSEVLSVVVFMVAKQALGGPFQLPPVKCGSFLEVPMEDMGVTFQTCGPWSFFDEGRSVGYWPQGSGCVWGAPRAAHPGPAWEL